MQHPLLGDKVYSGKKRAKLDQLWCQRHFLHAKSIEFFKVESMGQKKQVIEAELPLDLQNVFKLVIIQINKKAKSAKERLAFRIPKQRIL